MSDQDHDQEKPVETEQPAAEQQPSTATRDANYEVPENFVRSEAPREIPNPDTYREFLTVLMQHPKQVMDALNNMQKDTMPGTEEQQAEYLQLVEEALKHHGATDEKITPFGRDDSDWGNSVHHEGRKIGLSRPNAATMGNGKLSKEAARIKARAAAQLGTVATIPCWHSGTHVSFKAPGDIDLLYLERRMATSKILLGRATTGMLLSATSIYFTMDILNSAFSNVFDTTAPDMSPAAMKETHLITDIPQLIAGYAAAIYPDGYQLVRTCVHNPNECNYVVEQEVSIPKMFFVDRSRLNDYQRNHMLDKRTKQTKDSLEIYRRNHSFATTDVVKLDNMTIQLRVPTIARYESWADRWIQSIIDHTTEAFGETMSSNQRDTYLYQRAGASGLMQYGHFVEHIRYEDTNNEVTDYDTIAEVLSDLSGAKAFRKEFMLKVRSLISQATISAVGIPAYTCPSCKGEPVNVHPTLKTIIQLEVAEVFFTLMLKRLRNTLQQE